MDLQYISDTQGRHTAVVIPIEDWNNLTLKHQDLKALEKPKAESSLKKPSDFFGILSKQEADTFEKHTQQIRNEWDRTI